MLVRSHAALTSLHVLPGRHGALTSPRRPSYHHHHHHHHHHQNIKYNTSQKCRTTSSKLGVQFLGLGYYYPSTEKNRQVYPVWCSWLHNHTLFIKKLCKKLAVRPNFGGPNPGPPVVAPMDYALCYRQRNLPNTYLGTVISTTNFFSVYRVAQKSKLLILAVNEVNASQTRVKFRKIYPKTSWKDVRHVLHCSELQFFNPQFFIKILSSLLILLIITIWNIILN